jgi:hypothetical protein
MKKEFENILADHGIYGEDVEEILYAVQDMIDAVINKTKEEEPYATNTIERLEIAYREIFDLTYIYD